MHLYPYIAGKHTPTGKSREVISPFGDHVIATIDICDAQAVENALHAAQKAAGAMAELPAYKRFEALQYISLQLTVKRKELAVILAREAAKPFIYAIAEIDRAAQTFLVAAEEAKRLAGEYIRMDWTPAGKNKEGIIRYFPIGVVAGISPFNFPLNLAVHKIAPAIAAGCPIVLKPASSTPLSTLLLSQIIAETDLPSGAVNIVPADREAGNLLVTHDIPKLLSFTGSDVVGWKMKQQSGKKKCVLELGGNAGVIIGESADISTIIDTCISGAFSYQGQICIHAQRFFVHRSHYTAFVSAMAEQTKKLQYGAPELEDTTFSVMIDEENAIRVENWVNEAVQQGAQVICGGRREGKYYPPTILTETSATMKVNAEEIFGPVITITPFDQVEEATTLLNQGRFGLQAGIFTDSVKELDFVFRHTEVGGIIHNNVPTLRLDHMPYGGVKDSGLGREGVKYAMMDMLEPRILVK